MNTLFEHGPDLEQVDMTQAVALLGVCAATVRNWVKHEYLKPGTTAGKLTFDLQQLNELKSKIASGEIDRLTRRANKKESVLTFVPAEYAESAEVVLAVERIADAFVRGQLDIESTLLCVVLKLLEQNGLVDRIGSRELASIVVRCQTVRAELEWWFDHSKRISSPAYSPLIEHDVPMVRDFLGVLYQSLAKVGAKAQGGSYYTPSRVVDEIVADHVGANSVVLDPCCGTGQFLLAAAENVSNPLNLWGFDIDEIAVRLARLNVIIRFPDHNFSPNIFCKDALLAFPFRARFDGTDIPPFDVIFTNPPWGAHFSSAEIAQFGRLYPSIKSNEAFSLFVVKGLQLLRDGGCLSYILPESFLNIKVHADIRAMVSKQTRIRRVAHLGRIFQNVFTPAIRLDISKEAPSEGNSFIAIRENRSCEVEQSRLTENVDHVFDLFTGEEDLAIFERVYERGHLTLKGNADWALGIVTGNNAKFLSDHCGPHHEPILTGKDLRRFTADAPKKFIQFRPEAFQQVAPINKYRAPEKLIYKFISDELVFAYDDRQTLSLNSANVLIPALEGFSVKAVLGFLNCSLYQLIFQKRVGAFKLLRGDIEKLPFPRITATEHHQIVGHVDALINADSSGSRKKQAFASLDDYIMGLFDLTAAQRAYVIANASMSPKRMPFK